MVIRANRLSIAGNGSGGGGGGGGGGSSTTEYFFQVSTRALAFSSGATNMPFKYIAYSNNGIEGFTPDINIEVYDANTAEQLFIMRSVPTSSSTSDVQTINFYDYLDYECDVNRTYSWNLIFEDGVNRSRPQGVTFTIVETSVTPAALSLEDAVTDFEYGVVPHYANVFTNAVLHYEIIDQTYGATVQEGTVNDIRNGNTATFTISYIPNVTIYINTWLTGKVSNINLSSEVLTQTAIFIDENNPVPKLQIYSWPEK